MVRALVLAFSMWVLAVVASGCCGCGSCSKAISTVMSNPGPATDDFMSEIRAREFPTAHGELTTATRAAMTVAQLEAMVLANDTLRDHETYSRQRCRAVTGQPNTSICGGVVYMPKVGDRPGDIRHVVMVLKNEGENFWHIESIAVGEGPSRVAVLGTAASTFDDSDLDVQFEE